MKKTILLLFALLLSGCGVVLRYNYIDAINNMPAGSRLIYVNNDYIEYTNSSGHFKGHYVADSGQLFRIEQLKD